LLFLDQCLAIFNERKALAPLTESSSRGVAASLHRKSAVVVHIYGQMSKCSVAYSMERQILSDYAAAQFS
jgi:hypothetical protein